MPRPSICEDVRNKIYNIIHECRLRNDLVLPAERELAENLRVSRGTVRKVLDMLECDGYIIRDNQMTKILPAKKQRGRYAFCAASDDLSKYFIFGLYYNLWEDLCFSSQDYNIDLVLIPHRPESCSQELLDKLKQYDIIFVSYIREPVVNSMKKANLPLVMLDEQNADENYPLLCMDNCEVGRSAARELLEYGCRNALTIEYRNGQYKPFDLRRMGFIEEFEAGGGSVKSFVNSENMENPLLSMQEFVDELQNQYPSATDGIFFVSDEVFFYIDWFLRKKITSNPDLKITVFLGSGNFSRVPMQSEYWIMDNKILISEILLIIEKYETSRKKPQKFSKRMASVHFHKTIALSTKER